MEEAHPFTGMSIVAAIGYPALYKPKALASYYGKDALQPSHRGNCSTLVDCGLICADPRPTLSTLYAGTECLQVPTYSWVLQEEERQGMTRPQFARYYLMRLGIGSDLKRVDLNPEFPYRLASEENVLELRPELRPPE